MALQSTLTTPLDPKVVIDPDTPSLVNLSYNKQTITNPGATATIDPSLGAVIAIGTTTAATTLALTTTPKSTLNPGTKVYVIITSSGVTPTLLAGTGVHLSATVTLTANKAGVVELVYDGTELKQVAVTAALS